MIALLDPKLRDRVALVTGTNNPHGIGAAVAQAFAVQGAKVFLHYFRWTPQSRVDSNSNKSSSPGESFYYSQQTKSIDEVLERVRKSGAQVAALEADVADPAVIKTLFDQAEATLGPVEVLVNNAAYWEADTFLPTDADLANKLVELWTDRPQSLNTPAVDRMFAVNTRAPALMIAEFARRHITRGARFGRIINVSTAGAERFPSEVTYGASKFALESYTRSAAAELGKFGVTVNAVSLGPVQTGWITSELERAILPARIDTPGGGGRCRRFSRLSPGPLADRAADLCWQGARDETTKKVPIRRELWELSAWS